MPINQPVSWKVTCVFFFSVAHLYTLKDRCFTAKKGQCQGDKAFVGYVWNGHAYYSPKTNSSPVRS